jgi:aspartate 1-decarboxylase
MLQLNNFDRVHLVLMSLLDMFMNLSSFVMDSLQDQFDTVDLSDNEIVKLENLPNLNRLGTLLINNNRITRINPNIGGMI